MKRRYQMTVFVEFTDEQKPSAAAPAGAALRAQAQHAEEMITAAIADGVSRNVARSGVRVQVTSSEVVEP